MSESGKDVTAVVELRARFDEENNINWSTKLEEAGCKIIYGIDGYKIHSKITLITRKTETGIGYITHLATGNYNEKTARLYTDLGIITADEDIGTDAINFFNSIATANISADIDYSSLLVAPLHFKSEIIKLIDEEINKVKMGKSGYIRLKMNSLTDKGIICELVRASQSGVKVDLVIRGLCCLLPGIEGLTENINIISIVGRFLEHSRIFIFGEGREKKVYISSADLMTRNTTRRIEIAAPVLDEKIKDEIENIFTNLLKDNVKSRRLCSNSNYEKILTKDVPFDSQLALLLPEKD
jgi:polyphosphate kinase